MEQTHQKRSYVKWSDEDKAVLLQLVQKEKQNNQQTSWISIANVIKGKTPRQCYDQWLQLQKRNTDNPSHTWNSIELEALDMGMQEFGQQYEQIQMKYLPDISVQEIKTKCRQIHKLEKKKQKQYNNVESTSNSVVSSVMSSFMSEMSVATSNPYYEMSLPMDDVNVVHSSNPTSGMNLTKQNQFFDQDDDIFDILDINTIL